MEKHDLLVLNELTESGSNLRPSIQVEHALGDRRKFCVIDSI